MSRTELDSHSIMLAVGKNYAIMKEIGQCAEATPFAPDYESLQKMLIADAAAE